MESQKHEYEATMQQAQTALENENRQVKQTASELRDELERANHEAIKSMENAEQRFNQERRSLHEQVQRLREQLESK